MDDIVKEKQGGFSWWYLKDVPVRKKLAGTRFHTPGFGLASQLFASFCKVVLDRLDKDQAQEIIKDTVEHFGKERGRRIAQTVKKLGKPLSFKNWLIHTDIGTENFGFRPQIENGDLVVKVKDCTFINCAKKWDLGEEAALYCKYADYAILEGYNPDIKLVLKTRHDTGKDYCLFRYIMNEKNK